ncbi:aspartate kinase [Clostridium sp. 19966]|uniref:aspartate kinase n=1 Tax=Clostridium sp. 19966 TaxID=2768166 RepID=UPI0028E02854|nr:aspartate kinase [Clostridium sp. 19966]MDT8716410.1 aspartate kinase [Clostridium sp. 19966]
MNIIIQKFGGTSVSTKDRRKKVIDKIIYAIKSGFMPIVVVSAMGRLDDPYATDTLLSLVSETYRQSNKQGSDMLMCCGEIISSVVLSSELNDYGYKSMPMTGGQAGIITDEGFGDANILNADAEKITDMLKQSIIPIVTGFQGISKSGYFTTLGRGGSDVSAAILGGVLRADKVEIYTDVDGIMTADPRIVSNASLIHEISYNEVFQLADQGAKVIHPKAVEVAMRYNTKLVIKNTLNNSEGTLISSEFNMLKNNAITGITHMSNRLQINISSEENENTDSYDTILDVLGKNGLSIDLINVFPDKKIFTVDEEDAQLAHSLLNSMNIKYNFQEYCDKISIVGSGMKGVPGIMAKVLRRLRLENIEVLQTSDSHMTIWCLIKGEDTKKAIMALHDEFKLYISKYS